MPTDAALLTAGSSTGTHEAAAAALQYAAAATAAALQYGYRPHIYCFKQPKEQLQRCLQHDEAPTQHSVVRCSNMRIAQPANHPQRKHSCQTSFTISCNSSQ